MTLPNFYASAPFFDQVKPPCTDPKAKPSEFLNVKNQRVISIEGGRYRNSVVSGNFLLASDDNKYRGMLKEFQEFEVYCLWFGARLKQGAPKIKISTGNYSIKEDFSGLITCNIS